VKVSQNYVKDRVSIEYIAACCLYVVVALKYRPDPAAPRTIYALCASVNLSDHVVCIHGDLKQIHIAFGKEKIVHCSSLQGIQKYLVFFVKNICGMNHLWVLVLSNRRLLF
jgi:hypothetical protein